MPSMHAGFILLLCLSVAYAATLTWTGAAQNQLFSDPSNWNPIMAPSSADHVNIAGAVVVNVRSATTIMSMKVSQNAVVNVLSPLTYTSGISVDDTATLNVIASQVITTTPPIVNAPTPTNPNPSIAYPTISVSGKVNLFESTVSGTNPASSGNVEPTMVVIVTATGNFKLIGAKNANKLQNTRVSVTGTMSWERFSASTTPKDIPLLAQATVDTTNLSSDLMLSFAMISVTTTGKLILKGDKIILDASNPRSSQTSITVAGLLTVDTTDIVRAQGLEVSINIQAPITVTTTGALVLSSSSSVSGFVRFLNALSIDGVLTLKNKVQLSLSGTSHVFGASSVTNLPDGTAIYTEKGQSSLLGAINGVSSPSGSLVIRSTTFAANNVYVSELFLLDGSLTLGSTMITTPHQPYIYVKLHLYWEKGFIASIGLGNTRVVELGDSSVMSFDAKENAKSIKGVNLVINSKQASIATEQVLVLQQGANVIVNNKGVLALLPGSQILTDSSNNNNILIQQGGILSILTGTKPVVLDVNVIDVGQLVIGGTTDSIMGDSNIVAFTKSVDLTSISLDPVNSHAHIQIIPSDVNSRTVSSVSLPQYINGPQLDISIVGNKPTLKPSSNWSIKNLQLLNAIFDITDPNSVFVCSDSIFLGSGDGAGTPGYISGIGNLLATGVSLYQGNFTADSLGVGANGLNIFNTADKFLDITEINLASGSNSKFDANAKVHLSSRTHVTLYDSAKVKFSPGFTLLQYASPTNVGSSVCSKDRAAEIIVQRGTLNFLPSDDIILDVVVRNVAGHIQLQDGANALFNKGLIQVDASREYDVATGGDDSIVTLGKQSVLAITNSCNDDARITLGEMNGADATLYLTTDQDVVTNKDLNVCRVYVQRSSGDIEKIKECDPNPVVTPVPTPAPVEPTPQPPVVVPPVLPQVNPIPVAPSIPPVTEVLQPAPIRTANEFSAVHCPEKIVMGTRATKLAWILFGVTVGLAVISLVLAGLVVWKWRQVQQLKALNESVHSEPVVAGGGAGSARNTQVDIDENAGISMASLESNRGTGARYAPSAEANADNNDIEIEEEDSNPRRQKRAGKKNSRR